MYHYHTPIFVGSLYQYKHTCIPFFVLFLVLCLFFSLSQGAKAPFKELDIKAPLRQQLATVVILEYPVIHVYLPSQSYDFEVIRDFNQTNTTPNPNDSLCDGDGSTKAITFREEEIEEDDINSYEPKVIDLIKQMNYNPCQRVLEESKAEGGVTDNSHPQVDPTEQGVDGNMELEFEQGLIDTYSDLFEEMNPGDYFNFEFEFEKGLDSDDNCNLQNLATGFNTNGLEEDELEEGEILE